MKTTMYKKRMIMAGMMVACFMTACAKKPDSEERGGVRVAVGGGAYRGSRTDEDGAGSLSGDTNSVQDDESVQGGKIDSGSSLLGNNLADFLDACAGAKIERSIEAAGGTLLLINAEVNVEGITRVSQYEYELKDVTEEVRENLFRAVFSEDADKAEYDERNDVWTLQIDPEKIRNYFLYMIGYSNGGTTVDGEQIISLENRYYDLYPFDDNRLVSPADSKVEMALDEAAAICGQVVKSLAGTEDYAVDYIQAFGNNGRRPYYKIVFKRMLDGMPITTYNDLTFLFDNDGIESVRGSLFTVKELGLEEIILSLEEAVGKLQEQAVFLNFEQENQMMATRITLEYVVMKFRDGKALITPVWRFWLGGDEDERSFFRHKILAVDAVTGELIWEQRGTTM